MGKYSVVGTEVPKVMRHVARCTKGKHLGMHVQSKLQQIYARTRRILSSHLAR